MDENDGSFIVSRDSVKWTHLGETDMDGRVQHLAIVAVNALPALLKVVEAARKECAKFNLPDEDRPELHEALRELDSVVRFL